MNFQLNQSVHHNGERANTPLLIVLILSVIAGGFFFKANKDALNAIDRSTLEIAKHTLRNSNKNTMVELETNRQTLPYFHVDCNKLRFRAGAGASSYIRNALNNKKSSRSYATTSCDMRFVDKKTLNQLYSPSNHQSPSITKCLQIKSIVTLLSCKKSVNKPGLRLAEVEVLSYYIKPRNPLYQELKVSSKARIKVEDNQDAFKRACAHALNKNCMTAFLWVGGQKLNHQPIQLPCNTEKEYFDKTLAFPQISSILAANKIPLATSCIDMQMTARVYPPKNAGQCSTQIRSTLKDYADSKKARGEPVKYCPSTSSSPLPAVSEYPGDFGCSYKAGIPYPQNATFNSRNNKTLKRIAFTRTADKKIRVQFEDSNGKATDFDDYWLDLPKVVQGYSLGVRNTPLACP